MKIQRDILPIVEGSVVQTKHGPVKPIKVLFIGAGAFHVKADGYRREGFYKCRA